VRIAVAIILGRCVPEVARRFKLAVLLKRLTRSAPERRRCPASGATRRGTGLAWWSAWNGDLWQWLLAAPLLALGSPIAAWIRALPRGWRQPPRVAVGRGGLRAAVRSLSRLLVAWCVYALVLWAGMRRPRSTGH